MGEHARALSRRLWLTLLAGGAVAGILVPVATLLLALTGVAPMDVVGRYAWLVGSPPCVLGVHWLLFGPRRWQMLEMLIWAGRIRSAAFRAATGIRNPTSRSGATRWLAANPERAGEPPATAYWRAYMHLVLDAPAEAHRLAELVRRDPDLAVAADILDAQVDLAQGRAASIRELEAAARGYEASFERALTFAEIGALRAQAAWTCGADDVAAATGAWPEVQPFVRGYLLRSYWVPLALALYAAGALVLAFAG